MGFNIEENKVVIEAIATLIHVKSVMVEMILKPAGVPSDIYNPLLSCRDESSGKRLSKRQIAPLIIDKLDKRTDGAKIIRSILEITANWGNFHLANDEFAARATVQKARELLGTIETFEEQEKMKREQARNEEIKRLEREQTKTFIRESCLLLRMFDDLCVMDDHQRRGFLLQDLLNRLFLLNEIQVVKSFTRNEGAEQIDGAFRLEGWYYLVECRWREKLADIRQLDGLYGQVDRSGKQTMGLFLSMNGWSEKVPVLLKQNPDKSIILMDGYDLRCVISGAVKLVDILVAKITQLNLFSEPFLSAKDYLGGS